MGAAAERSRTTPHEARRELERIAGQAWAAALGGAALALWACWGLALGVWVRDWPQADAVGLSAEVRRSTRIGRGARSTWYAPELRYRYTVGGVAYEGSVYRWQPELAFRDPADAGRAAAEYGAGRRFRVFYDPRRPASAFVAPPTWGGADLLLIASAAISWCVALYRLNDYRTSLAFYRVRVPGAFEPDSPAGRSRGYRRGRRGG